MNARVRTLACGTAFMLVPGAIYAFSGFAQALSLAFGWSRLSLAVAFGISLFFNGVAAAIGGPIVDRRGPRLVALAGVLLVALGDVLVAFGTTAFGLPWFYVAFGVVGGLGGGFAYIAGTATIMRTQTRRFGFGAGLAALGFGLGSLVYGGVVRSTPQYASVAATTETVAAATDYASKNGLNLPPSAAHLPPAIVQTLLEVFLAGGIAIAIYGFVFAMLLHDPERCEATIADRPLRAVVTTMQWWFLWLAYFIATVAGGGIMANSTEILRDVTDLPTADPAGYLTFFALSGCVGRIGIGAAVDHVGYRRMTSIILLVQAMLYFGLASIHAFVPAVALFAAAYFTYGGLVAVLGGWTAQSFGTRHFGAIWGLLVTGFGTAGLVGPWFLSNVYEITGSYGGALMPMGLMLAVCALLPALMHERGAASSEHELRPKLA